MRRRIAFLALSLPALACAAPLPFEAQPGEAVGFVFHDANGNGARDAGERGLEGVAVSNGREVARTGPHGRYRLPAGDDTIFFVIKPRDWAPPVNDAQLPRFFHVHKPQGSPPGLDFPGVAPTGPLPESVDFPLLPRREPDAFRMILFGDTQPYSLREVDWLSRDLIEGLIGSDAAFGMTLGDLVGDDLSLFEPLNGAVARIGVPWYNVHGNHDMNFRAASDAQADETFERVYGPATYAFQVGAVHFVVLDDVVYQGYRAEEGRPGGYRGGLSERQLAFVANYLALVPRDHLVVLAMHIPLAGEGRHQVPERRRLLDVLSSHPHTLSLSAHTHFQEHRFFGPESGYDAPNPHHHLNHATTSGSWWLGRRDEVGVPHAMMRCGAPNGYSLLDFDGSDYAIRFRAARRPPDYQLSIFAPDSVRADEVAGTEVVVNVFAGSERSVVEMRTDPGSPWIPLERVARKDPHYQAARAREAGGASDRPPLPAAIDSSHVWVGRLPADLPPGTHAIEVRSADMFGQVFTAHRLIRLE